MAEIGKDFPLTRERRKLLLKRIIEENKPVGTYKVPGFGRLSVYRIPLECLSYNPYNTRFIAQAKTLEKRLGRKLSDENPDDLKEIEKFIWEEKLDKNVNFNNNHFLLLYKASRDGGTSFSFPIYGLTRAGRELYKILDYSCSDDFFVKIAKFFKKKYNSIDFSLHKINYIYDGGINYNTINIIDDIK